MAGGISDGLRVSAANSNAAWLSKNGDDTTVGIITLNNSDGASGPSVPNVQGAINNANTFTGQTNTLDTTPTYSSTNYVSGSLEDAIGDLDAQVKINSDYIASTAYVQLSIFTTKGDLVAATGSGAASRLAAGANNYALIADSAQSSGLKYANIGVEKSVLAATSSVKTPAASAQYQSLSGNNVTLAANSTYELTGFIKFDNSGAAPTYNLLQGGFYGSNGADSGTAPTLLSATPNLTVNSAYDIAEAFNFSSGSLNRAMVTIPTVIVATGGATVTVYVVSYCQMTTAANARVTAYITARKLY